MAEPIAEGNADPELARLAALADYDILGHEYGQDPALNALAELAVQLCGGGFSAINLIGARRQHQIAGFGVDFGLSDRSDSMCATTLDGDRDLIVEDAREDPRFAGNPWVTGRLGKVRFYAATLLRSPSGHPLGTLSVFDEQPRTIDSAQQRALALLGGQVIEVLELRRRGNRLTETIAELSRSHRQLENFSAQVSHDLKTPLTSMLGFTELLEDMPAVVTDPLARTYLGRTASSGRRMLGMIEDMLRYASLGGRIDPRPIRLGRVMAELVDDLGTLTERAVIHWDDAVVYADAGQLRVLLQNLITNAISYRRPDVPGLIDVSVARRREAVELRVIDNGQGIPPERRLDVLAPLTRLNREVAGTGLGLAACSRIVAAHGGTLHITATPGGGTTVTSVLPIPADERLPTPRPGGRVLGG
jgi:signal transduction histidine kinase